MKEIEIIPLALKKALRRGIPEEWIRETVDSPEQIVEGYGGRNVAHKKYEKGDREYLLRVEALAKVLKQANLSFRVKREIFYNQLGIRFLTFVRNDNL